MLASSTATVVASAAPVHLADQDAQHVGMFGEIFVARAVAGGDDSHRRQRAEVRGERGGDAPRPLALSVRRSVRARRSACPTSSSAAAGAGTGSTPCSVLTVPLPTFSGELWIASTPSRSKADARAHDVADRIHRAHFMEMDFLDRHAVHLGLGLAQALKHRRGILFDALRAGRISRSCRDVRRWRWSWPPRPRRRETWKQRCPAARSSRMRNAGAGAESFEDSRNALRCRRRRRSKRQPSCLR